MDYFILADTSSVFVFASVAATRSAAPYIASRIANFPVPNGTLSILSLQISVTASYIIAPAFVPG